MSLTIAVNYEVSKKLNSEEESLATKLINYVACGIMSDAELISPEQELRSFEGLLEFYLPKSSEQQIEAIVNRLRNGVNIEDKILTQPEEFKEAKVKFNLTYLCKGTKDQETRNFNFSQVNSLEDYLTPTQLESITGLSCTGVIYPFLEMPDKSRSGKDYPIKSKKDDKHRLIELKSALEFLGERYGKFKLYTIDEAVDCWKQKNQSLDAKEAILDLVKNNYLNPIKIKDNEYLSEKEVENGYLIYRAKKSLNELSNKLIGVKELASLLFIDSSEVGTLIQNNELKSSGIKVKVDSVKEFLTDHTYYRSRWNPLRLKRS